MALSIFSFHLHQIVCCFNETESGPTVTKCTLTYFPMIESQQKKNKWIKKFPLFVTKIERVTNLATSYRLVNSKIYMNKKSISIKGSAIAIGIVWYSFWICKFCKSIEFLIFHLFCRMLLCVYSCWHQPNFSSVLLVLGI